MSLIIVDLDRSLVRPSVLFVLQLLHVALLFGDAGINNNIVHGEHRGRPAEEDLECSTLEPPLLHTPQQTGNVSFTIIEERIAWYGIDSNVRRIRNNVLYCLASILIISLMLSSFSRFSCGELATPTDCNLDHLVPPGSGRGAAVISWSAS